MPTQRKVETVDLLIEKMKRTQWAVVADYRGLTVAQMGELRAKLREHGAEVIVAKNTLLRIAARETKKEAIEPLLAGPTAITLVYDNLPQVAKAFEDLLKQNEKFQVRGSVLGNSIVPLEGFIDVAKMPSREEVYAQIAGGLMSPLAGLVGMLDAPASDIVGILDAPVTDVVGIFNAVVNDIGFVIQARVDQLQAEAPAA